MTDEKRFICSVKGDPLLAFQFFIQSKLSMYIFTEMLLLLKFFDISDFVHDAKFSLKTIKIRFSELRACSNNSLWKSF